MSGFEPLNISCAETKERDARYLSGGNFFGTEAIAPPPLEPLAIDFMEEEELVDASPAGGASSSGAGSSSKAAAAAPPLMIKLPARGKAPK